MICPFCGAEISPLESFVVVEDASGERFDAHVSCADSKFRDQQKCKFGPDCAVCQS